MTFSLTVSIPGAWVFGLLAVGMMCVRSRVLHPCVRRAGGTYPLSSTSDTG